MPVPVGKRQPVLDFIRHSIILRLLDCIERFRDLDKVCLTRGTFLCVLVLPICLNLCLRHTVGCAVRRFSVRLTLYGIIIAAWSKYQPDADKAREAQHRIDRYRTFQPLTFSRSLGREPGTEFIEHLHIPAALSVGKSVAGYAQSRLTSGRVNARFCNRHSRTYEEAVSMKAGEAPSRP